MKNNRIDVLRLSAMWTSALLVFAFMVHILTIEGLMIHNIGHKATRLHIYNKLRATNHQVKASRSNMRLASTSARGTAVSTSFWGNMKTRSNIISYNLISIFCKLASLANPTIIGGLLSGGLHAITGPDHIAALLPASVGASASRGMTIGAWWGLGHGTTATLLGLAAFYLKGQIGGNLVFLEKLSSFAEWAVGASLLLIGGIGVRDSLSTDEVNTDGHGDGAEEQRISTLKSSRAIFVNGLLHGCSLDGAPSLAPALVLTTWRSVISFLLAYCFGTMAAMSLAAGAVAEGTVRLGEVIGSSQLPKQLSLGSSAIAILIGVYWIITAASV